MTCVILNPSRCSSVVAAAIRDIFIFVFHIIADGLRSASFVGAQMALVNSSTIVPVPPGLAVRALQSEGTMRPLCRAIQACIPLHANASAAILEGMGNAQHWI